MGIATEHYKLLLMLTYMKVMIFRRIYAQCQLQTQSHNSIRYIVVLLDKISCTHSTLLATFATRRQRIDWMSIIPAMNEQRTHAQLQIRSV